MRQTGYYRVKTKHSQLWDYAYYDSVFEVFTLCRFSHDFRESELDEINEEPQNPEPPKKTGLDGDGYPIEVK